MDRQAANAINELAKKGEEIQQTKFQTVKLHKSLIQNCQYHFDWHHTKIRYVSEIFNLILQPRNLAKKI